MSRVLFLEWVRGLDTLDTCRHADCEFDECPGSAMRFYDTPAGLHPCLKVGLEPAHYTKNYAALPLDKQRSLL